LVSAELYSAGTLESSSSSAAGRCGLLGDGLFFDRFFSRFLSGGFFCRFLFGRFLFDGRFLLRAGSFDSFGRRRFFGRCFLFGDDRRVVGLRCGHPTLLEPALTPPKMRPKTKKMPVTIQATFLCWSYPWRRSPCLSFCPPAQSDDQVDEGPDAETAEGDEFEDAGADLAEVETVDAESAEQPRQQPRSEERFLPDEGLVLAE
jgi:hypothetical protein